MKADKFTLIKVRYTAVIGGIFALFAILITVIYCLSLSKSIFNEKKQVILSIAKEKADNISSGCYDETEDARIISESKTLKSFIDGFRYGYNRNALSEYLDEIKVEHDYSDVILFSADGKSFQSTNPAVVYNDSAEISFLNKSVYTGKCVFSDIYISPTDNKLYVDFVTAVKNNYGKVVAVLIFKKDAVSFIDQTIAGSPFNDISSRLFLLEKDIQGNVVKHSPFSDRELAGDAWTRYKGNDEIRDKFLNSENGFIKDRIIRKSGKLSYMMKVSNTPWTMVIEADNRNLFSELYYKVDVVAIACFLAILAFISAIYMAISSRQNRALRRRVKESNSLSAMKERSGLIMDMVEDGIIITDDEGLIKYMNIFAESLLGWDLSEVKSHSLEEIFVFADKSRKTGLSLNSWLGNDKALSSVRNVKILTRKGDEVVISYNVIYNGFGPENEIVLTFQNETENMRQKSLIMKSETRFRNFFQDAPDGFMIIDRNGAIKLANMHTVFLFGYNMDQLVGMSISQLIPGDYTRESDFLIQYKNPEKIERGKNIRFIAVRKDGTLFNTRVALSPVSYEDQMMTMATIRDITKIVMNEENLMITNNIVNNMNDGVFLVNPESKEVTYMNPRMKEILGYASEETDGKFILSKMLSVANDQGIDVPGVIASILAGKINEFKLKLPRNDGTYMWVKVFLHSFFSDKSGTVWMGLVENITEQVAAETEAFDESSRFNQLVAVMRDVAVTFSADGSEVLDVNEAFENVFGISKDEIKNDSGILQRIVHPNDLDIARNGIQELNANGESETVYRIIRPDSRIVSIVDRRKIVFDSECKPRLIVCVIRDITKDKNYENELLVAKAKAEDDIRKKAALIANMNEEILEIINDLTAYITILKNKDINASDRTRYDDKISESIDQLRNILDKKCF